MRAFIKFTALAILVAATNVSSLRAEEQVRWAPNLEAAKQMASRQNKLVMIHFWANACPPCRALEANVFTKTEFASAVDRNYVPVKVNAELMPATARQYKVDRWPQDVIITPSGQLVFKMISPQKIDQYTNVLAQVSAKANPSTEQIAAKPATGPAAPAYTPGGTSQFAQSPAPATQNLATQPVSTTVAPSRFSNAPATNVAANQQAPYAPAYGQQAPTATNTSRFAGPMNTNPAPAMSTQPPAVQPRPNNTQVANTAPQAQPPKQAPAAAPLPPNVALDGHCCVTLAEKVTWQKGDTRWGAVHMGKVYLFASEVDQKKFLASPNKFSPVMSGNDPVVFLEQGKVVAGSRHHGLTYQGTLYLFSSEESLEKFWQAPNNYVGAIQQAMQRTINIR